MSVELFIWRYGVLDVNDYYDTVERAIRAAVSIADHGDGAPHGVRDGDDWITPNDERWKTIEQTKHDAEDEAMRDRPKNTHVLEVQAPSGEWAVYDGFPSFDEARSAADRFRTTRIRKTGPGPHRAIWTAGSEKA